MPSLGLQFHYTVVGHPSGMMKELMENQGRHRWKWLLLPLLLIILLGAYSAWSLKRPLPDLKPEQPVIQSQVTTPNGSLAWPASGQAAVAIPGTQMIETHGVQKPLPIASTAKLITALTVLQQKPLEGNQQGPIITLTDHDAALYNAYLAQGGSVVRVTAGEKISEYQMLQAIMLPSANNMADSLAIWAFGSLNNYAVEANKYVQQLGLHNTHIGTDASGLSPTTTSTAQDLVLLGEKAMQNPVLAQIVGQPTATGLPVAGDIKNVNFLLGTDNIIGIKTGNTEEAGGVFVGAAKATVNNKQPVIVTAILGSPSLFAAMKDSLALIQSAQGNFKPVQIVKSGTIVGSYKVPWGGTINAAADETLGTSAWAGSSIIKTVHLRNLPANSHTGQDAGTVKIPNSTLTEEKFVIVKLRGSPDKPTTLWRLTHPLQ